MRTFHFERNQHGADGLCCCIITKSIMKERLFATISTWHTHCNVCVCVAFIVYQYVRNNVKNKYSSRLYSDVSMCKKYTHVPLNSWERCIVVFVRYTLNIHANMISFFFLSFFFHLICAKCLDLIVFLDFSSLFFCWFIVAVWCKFFFLFTLFGRID